MDKLFLLGIDLVFYVEKIFYHRKTVNKNYINDICNMVQLKDKFDKEKYQCNDDAIGMHVDAELTKHMKMYYDDSVILNPGSYYMNFDEFQYVCICKNHYKGVCQEVVNYPYAVLIEART